MWSSHKDFHSIISSNLPASNNPFIMRLIRDYFSHLRLQFQQMNRNHFADLKEQHISSRNALLQLQQDLQRMPDDESLKLQE